MLESLSSFLCGVLTPLVVCAGGLILAFAVRLPRLLAPRRFLSALLDSPRTEGTSPFTSLTMALAGTLGVGNITGVAAALVSGGPGAIFWMWLGALFSMSLKYGEVALAVRYRRGGNGAYYGGAMYYLCDGLGRRFPGRSFRTFGVFFALLCVLNSLVTGNLIQANSAAAVVPFLPKAVSGFLLALLLACSLAMGVDKIGRITSRLIPLLSGLYAVLSLAVFFTHLSLLPALLSSVFRSAFSFRAAAGGLFGATAKEAIRFGVTRGIFSNEAGCGTSPTAHASADAKSPFHQGCFGIFEVIVDTLILCSMTAFVILTASYGPSGLLSLSSFSPDGAANGTSLAIDAFASLLGAPVAPLLSVSVLLFAYATMLAQLYYGTAAIRFCTGKRLPRYLYFALSVGCAFAGAVTRMDTLWLLADWVVCVMTVINVSVLLLLRREIAATVPR